VPVDTAGKFGSLATQLESQRKELTEMRDLKKLAESRLDRVVQDIERLCGTLTPRPGAETSRTVADSPQSAFRSRIAEHIRKAAVEAAPDASNPLVGDPLPKKPLSAASETKAPAVDHAVPGFDDWKRQFMQDGEPLNPTMVFDEQKKIKLVVCPRCFSERTRPASPVRLDALFRLTGLSPHRCRSCSHRFYKRGGVTSELPIDDEDVTSRTEEVLESQ